MGARRHDYAYFGAEPPPVAGRGMENRTGKFIIHATNTFHDARQAVEQGLNEMRRIITAGVAVTAGAWLALGMAAPAMAQEMSENSVQTLMDYAWSLTPDRFTKPDGVVVEVDRNNRKAAEVPMETAREVIKAGRLSAHAQTCCRAW